MRGIRLSSLGITAFRGISEPVRFDLSAPLTLVFAPNGTGKTTMCEAAEWLLTGQVERLKGGKGFDAHVLRSKFAAEGQTPTVEADLFVAGKQRFLSRVAEGAQSPASWGETRDAEAHIGPHELLSLLAPAAAADEAHHLTAINLRQRWLKGTRFLSAEALAALVDTDEETIERRTQVFADLLGIRHLLDAERQCEKYANEMGAGLRTLTRLIDQQSSEAHALEEALAGEDLPAGGTVSARSEAVAAAKLLNLYDPAGQSESRNLDDQLAALTATTACSGMRSMSVAGPPSVSRRNGAHVTRSKRRCATYDPRSQSGGGARRNRGERARGRGAGLAAHVGARSRR